MNRFLKLGPLKIDSQRQQIDFFPIFIYHPKASITFPTMFMGLQPPCCS